MQRMTPEEEPQWRAAIGKNADRYLGFFRRLSASGRRWSPGWNTAAFLHSTGWFCHRRMYGWALVNLLAPWLPILFLAASVRIFPHEYMNGLALALLAAYLAGVFILIPVFADSAYYRHLAKRMPHARPPSFWTHLGAAAFGLVWFVVVAATISPALLDHSPRAKMSEAILSASLMRTAVAEFHQEHRRWPAAAEAMKLANEPQSRVVQSVVWDPAQRAIVITMRDPFPGKRFALRAVEQQGGLSWKCGTIDIEKKHMPGSCRD